MSLCRSIISLSAAALVLIQVENESAAVVSKMAYHGWSEALTVSNGKVEAIVVPAIGRVMQFRFKGEEGGPFWENRALDGKAPDSQSSDWLNFGGDKTWPAPQAEWEKNTGRGWPPPAAFDSMAVDAIVQGEKILLRSKVDPHYGIQVERSITLDPDAPVMRIETTYLKKEGGPVRVAIWTITQLHDPELMLMPLPEKSIFPSGYNKQSDVLPLDLKVENGWVTCRRSSKDSTKIGSDASKLLWGGKTHIVEVESTRERQGEFPDQSSSAEIYTNADPLPYIELELLGPLQRLVAGDKISRVQVYRLFQRSKAPLREQMRSIARGS